MTIIKILPTLATAINLITTNIMFILLTIKLCDSNGFRTQNHLVRKRTLNPSAGFS